MSTTTQRTTAPHFSPTVAKLIAQIHTEAEAATLAALSAMDGIVVLHPMPSTRWVEHCTSSGFSVRADDGSELLFFIDHRPKGAHGRALIGPRWAASQTMVDGSGRGWSSFHGGNFITDDFGTLVNVKGGAV